MDQEAKASLDLEVDLNRDPNLVQDQEAVHPEVMFNLEFRYARKTSEERRAMIAEWNKEKEKEVEGEKKFNEIPK